MAQCILVVDDKQSLRQLIKDYLEQEGFRVVEAADGRAALFVARQEKPDLIILDLMMPEMGGYEFMRVFSKEADTPIIILTARLEENDRVLGLELGADDYITKPFSMREMAARVRAVLRRTSRGASQADIVHVAGITLDRAGHSVKVNEQAVDLTPTEFDLLATLMMTPGRAFSRAELLERVQDGLAFDGIERTIDAHIHNLRNKIETDPGQPHYIETVYGVGYRFCTEEQLA
jgi:two-component system alkaline phosphatase synthesis response regulator PhoP